MLITPFLNGHTFDPETKRVLGIALEIVCISLRAGDSDDDVKQVITTKIIELAIAGECNPDVLAEKVLKDIRGPVGSHQLPPHASPPVLPDS